MPAQLVVRGATAHRVQDGVGLNLGLVDLALEDVARAPYEGQALLVLLPTGSLAYEDDVWVVQVRAPHADKRVGTGDVGPAVGTGGMVRRGPEGGQRQWVHGPD